MTAMPRAAAVFSTRGNAFGGQRRVGASISYGLRYKRAWAPAAAAAWRTPASKGGHHRGSVSSTASGDHRGKLTVSAPEGAKVAGCQVAETDDSARTDVGSPH